MVSNRWYYSKTCRVQAGVPIVSTLTLLYKYTIIILYVKRYSNNYFCIIRVYIKKKTSVLVTATFEQIAGRRLCYGS